jgi:undecaprenyl-diphosphatase
MDFIRGLDWGTLYWLGNHPTPYLQPVVLDLNALGGPVVLALVVLGALLSLLAVGRPREAAFILIATVVGVTVLGAIQWLIGGQRPDTTTVSWLSAGEVPAGFPTGNALFAVLIYMTLALTIAPLMPRRPPRLILVGAGILLSLVSGLTRLYLGVCFLTDMFSAWIGGLLWALMSREVYARWIAGPARHAGGPT